MNLNEMSRPQLCAFLRSVEIELVEREKQQRAEAMRQIQSIASQSGVNLADLVAPGNLRLRKPVPIKYRHPDNPDLTWTGRGRSPIWVREWETQHGSREGITVSTSI